MLCRIFSAALIGLLPFGALAGDNAKNDVPDPSASPHTLPQGHNLTREELIRAAVVFCDHEDLVDRVIAFAKGPPPDGVQPAESGAGTCKF